MKRLLFLLALLTASAAAQTTSTLASGGIGISCNAVTTATSTNPGLAGGCTSFNLVTSGGNLPVVYTWQTITTGSPASLSVTLVGSIDGSTWTTIDTATSATTRTATGTAYRFLGCVPGTMSGGSSPTVTCQISVSSGTTGGASGLSGMTAGQVPIAATSNTVTSSAALQGTDTNILTAGTVSGTAATLCTDANGGATTTGCTSGGSGTVSANNTAVGAVASYAAAAGSTTVGPTTGVTATSNEVDTGVNGTASGVFGWNGSTSGKATCTAPAVAGTTNNAVVCTNDFSVPGISLANPVAVPSSATGMFNNAASNVLLYSNGTNWLLGNASKVSVLKQLDLSGSGSTLFVASNFTTAANTSLQTITGLSYTWIAAAAAVHFHCSLAYSQATGNAAVAFGIQAATNAPTNIFATGQQQISTTTPFYAAPGILPTLTTTTATNIVSGTPGATGTNYTATLDGTLELAASANTINFMVSTATSGDAVTVLRGSYCMIF